MKRDGPILGADTETFEGGVKLLAFSDGSYVEPSSPDYTDQLLDALWAKAREARWVVFWNLGFDVSAIIKPWVVAHADTFRATHYANIRRRQRLVALGLKEDEEGLTPEELRERQEINTALDGEETVERFDTERYHVVLIGAKGMSVSPKHESTHGRQKEREWFFDAAAWYSSSFGGVSLDYAAKKFLGEGKSNEDLGIDRARIGAEKGYYESHRDLILRYCVQDCALTARLMALTVEGFERLGYPFPDKPFSRASVSREYLKESGRLDATAASYEFLSGNSYRDLWTKSFRGGVFLLMGAGRWLNPFGLDLNSAYPDAMVRFPSLEDAVVVDPTDPRFKSCFFTFYRITLAPTPRTPTRDRGETRKIYGWDETETSLCVTGLDLAILDEMGESYTVERACGVYTPHAEDKPLAYLAEIYERKSEVKAQYGADSVEYANLKILLNGTYGILAQRRPRESRWTNLIYASYVTAWCRQKLWRAVRETEERGDYVVSLATDGLLVFGEKSREYWRSQDSKELGGWSYTAHQEAICYENGVGFLDATEVKKRGMPRLTREALLACDANEWSEVSQRPVKLRTALIQKRTEFLGIFEEHKRTLCPAKSYYDAGMAFPKELQTMPLRLYFERSWKLRLRGQRGDRLTPPRDPAQRRAWEAVLRRGRPEQGYLYPPRPSFSEVAKVEKRGGPARDEGKTLEERGPEESRGARRSKGPPSVTEPEPANDAEGFREETPE